MAPEPRPQGGNLFVVDNSDQDWKVFWYLKEWTDEQGKMLTRALVLAAETLHIKVFDHLIVSAGKVFSFRKERLL